jgi:riboflavin biosynthesis pyrimidine reductase
MLCASSQASGSLKMPLYCQSLPVGQGVTPCCDAEVLRVLMKAAHDSGIQSMMVEGGRHTLQSFIDNHLYDEIRVEQSPQTVASGTPAPQLPADISVVSRQEITGNTITLYRYSRT